MEWNMDDDHKIAPKPEAVRKEVRLFLEEAIDSLKNVPPSVYDVDEEYAKNRKNHSWSVIFIVGGVLIVIGLGLWLAAGIISKQMREVSVEIETFDDLNLRTLLDIASRVESAFNKAMAEQTSLEGLMRTELATLAFNAENERLVIADLTLPPGEANTRLAAINRRLARDENAVRQRYAASINELEAEIEGYRKQLSVFDQTRTEAAQNQQKAINAERMHFARERNRLQSFYENIIAELRAKLSAAEEANLQTQGQVQTEAPATPDRTHIIPDDTDVLPDNTDVLPDDTDVLPDDTDVLPDDTDVLPDNADVLPDNADILPDNAAVLPDNTDVLPEAPSQGEQ
jgi:hypothetical protein